MMKKLPALFCLLLLPVCALAQGRIEDELHWGLATVNPYGNRFEIDYVSPSVHKWYGQRHLPETYMGPWYQSDTRYAVEHYDRYVNNLLEGSDSYDTFGTYIGRGWLVYNWSQEQPLPRGSRIDKDTGGNAYQRFFGRLVVAGDRREGGNYRLMVGDEIYTFFTPLTFYKPRFNGVRMDYNNDRIQATLLASRPSAPDGEERTDVTQMLGGHAKVQLGERSSLGFTYVNAHNAQTELEFNEGNPLRGTLATQQNRTLDKLWVRVRDDSPGQGDAPAILADYEIVIEDREGNTYRGREVNLLPKITGGGNEGGRLVARDAENILLEYDLSRFKYEDITAAEITRATFELSVANDYRIEVASNVQTDGERFNPEIVFLPVRRSLGNVQDNSNTGFIKVDYGLPTANELLGTDWELIDWHGLSLRGEAVLNRRFFLYPNSVEKSHYQHSIDGTASYLQADWDLYPFALFFEGFNIEDEYTTNYWLVDKEGRIRYKDPVPQIIEFVDDDDDYNARPEWQRPDLERSAGGIVRAQRWDNVAWPGFDENGDFVNDHNQNRNSFPDYEEPFLRFRSDRPEFLFGLDMNHNGTTDRFENDNLPDYPYKSDHRGFNAHSKTNIGPNFALTLGRQHMKLISGDGETRAWYSLLSWKYRFKGGSGVRFFAHGASVNDNISDDLWLWFQPLGSPGRMREELDQLPLKDAWKSTLYADFDQRIGPDIRLLHRIKWDQVHQREKSTTDLFGFPARRASGFFGLINKAEWSVPVGLAVFEPRWKSEYRRDRPFTTRLSEAESLEETMFLLWTQPLFAESSGVSYFPRYGRQLFDSQVQVGLERSWFWMLEGAREEIAEDFNSWTLLLQLTNRVAYQGYQLVTRLGVQVEHQSFAKSASESASMLFLSMNAGL
jgi:hypothetical protein